MSERCSLGLALLLCSGLVACSRLDDSRADAEWSGSVSDSAGVRIVSSPEVGLWAAETEWIAEIDLAIGAEGLPEYEFGRIADVDVDTHGRIYVLDDRTAKVSVYDAGGRYLRAFGRRGRGPGEFSIDVLGLRVDGTGNVAVRDRINRRDNVFDSTGMFVQAVPVEASLREWEPLTDGGNVSRLTTATWDGLVLIGTSGHVVDTVVRFEYDIGRTQGALSSGPAQSGTGPIPIPLLPPAPVWTVTTDGRIATGLANQYRLEVRRPSAPIELVITKPGAALLLKSEDRARIVERVKALMRATGMPEDAIVQVFQRFAYLPPDSLPAFADIAAGPHGTIWVRRLAPFESMQANATLDALIPGGPGWDVFCPDGRFLGRITLPERFDLRRIRGDRIYGVEMDEFNVQRVVRLRIESGQGAAAIASLCNM